jgi:5-formyltetrahydrofolate cyclo-ligase
MGGGYYDRYFAETSRRPLIIGVGYDVQQAEHTLPTEPWDVHLDGVVTESGFRLFRS